MLRRSTLALVLALVAGTGAACSSDEAAPNRVAPDPAGAAVTTFPDLEQPDEEQLLPGLDTAAPDRGAVVQVAGPFDDRFVMRGLTLDAGVVTGRLSITSDVSELLELEVQVGFYDAAGAFLGSGSFVHHLDESVDGHEASGPPSETETFTVRAPRRFAARVDAAAVGVPVLVNE